MMFNLSVSFLEMTSKRHFLVEYLENNATFTMVCSKNSLKTVLAFTILKLQCSVLKLLTMLIVHLGGKSERYIFSFDKISLGSAPQRRKPAKQHLMLVIISYPTVLKETQQDSNCVDFFTVFITNRTSLEIIISQ